MHATVRCVVVSWAHKVVGTRRRRHDGLVATLRTMSSGSSGSRVALPEPSLLSMFCLMSRMVWGRRTSAAQGGTFHLCSCLKAKQAVKLYKWQHFRLCTLRVKPCKSLRRISMPRARSLDHSRLASPKPSQTIIPHH